VKASTRRILEVVALVGVIGGLAYQSYYDRTHQVMSWQVASPVPPRFAPSFSLPDYLGRERIRLSSYQGKVVLLNFYEASCQHCRREIPDLNTLYRRLKPQGFEIIGISLHRGDRKSIARLAEQYQIPYALALGNEGLVKSFGGIEGTPTSFLIDRQGRIVRVFPGSIDRMTLLKAIQPLLEASESPAGTRAAGTRDRAPRPPG